MPATFIADHVEGSTAERDGNKYRAIRMGTVKDLDVNTDAKFDVLFAAMTASGVPTEGSSHPSRGGLILRKIQVVGVSGNTARIALIYESDENTALSSSGSLIFTVTDDSTLERFETTFVRGRLIWTNGFVTTASGKMKYIPNEPVPMRLFRSLRSVTARGLVKGVLTEGGIENANLNGVALPKPSQVMNRVNKTTWLGLQPGYWMITGYRTMAANYPGFFGVEVSAATKTDEDWSHTGILINKLTGNPVRPDDAELQAALAKPWQVDPVRGNGFVREFPYLTTEFRDLFGF
jgi:hypothetical protein